MTDPVFALDPMCRATCGCSRAGCFSSVGGLREGSLTVREGAQTFIWRPRRRAARGGAGLRAGGVLASADRRQLAAAEAGWTATGRATS